VIGLSSSNEKDLEAEMEKFSEEQSKKRREALKNEYLDLKNLGFILVDFVPCERKSQMVEGLKSLFSSEGGQSPSFSR
jgi:hypothetical protein